MQKRTIYQLIVGTIILAIVIAGFFLFRFFYPAQKSDLKLLLPKETTLVVEVNAHQVMKTVMKDVLENKEDLGISLSQLKEKWKHQEMEYPGIDFNKELVFFSDKWNDINVYGFLVHISKLKDFEHFKMKGSTTQKANKKHGIILYADQDLSRDEKDFIVQKAEKIIDRNVPKRVASKEIIHFSFNENKTSTSFSIYLEKETLRLTGTNFTRDRNNSPSDSMTLVSAKEKDYLEIRTGQLPQILNHFLEDYLKGMNIYLPEITAQRLLIYNSNVQTINKKLTILPELDWVVQFADGLDIKYELNKSRLPNYLNYDSTAMLINAKKLNYYIKQSSPNEIYIGNTPLFGETKEAVRTTFSISGQPAVLMSLDGDGFVAKMIHVLPPVRSAQKFLNDISVFHFETKEQENGKQIIEGELKLSDQKAISIELLKFILN